MGERHRSRLGWLPVGLVLLVLGAAVVAWRLDLATPAPPAPTPDPTAEPAAVPPPQGLDIPALPVPDPVAGPAGRGAVAAAAVRRTLAPGLGDPDLGRSVVAAVAPLLPAGAGSDAGWSTGGGAFVPASTTKVATAAAALSALGPDHVFATTVVRQGGTLTLVGGGDPLLARTPDPDAWPARADVTTLARRTAASLPGNRRLRLEYDASLFTGPAENPAWRADYVPDDIVSPISALWVDEGLAGDGSSRVADPAADAAAAFATALRREGVRLVGAPVPGSAAGAAGEVARVESAPLDQVAERVLLVSDNEGAEVLAHHVGLATSGEGSFAGGEAGVRRTLQDLGVPLRGTLLRDGSGLSRQNRMHPDTLLAVLRLAAADAHPELRAVLTGLPVAGFTGSLAFRFDQAPLAGVGTVRAKTGSLTGVRSLAGVAVDSSGVPLAFVVAADRLALLDTLDAEQDLDNLAATLGGCRCTR